MDIIYIIHFITSKYTYSGNAIIYKNYDVYMWYSNCYYFGILFFRLFKCKLNLYCVSTMILVIVLQNY